MDSHATTSGHLVVVGDFNIHWDTDVNSAVKFKDTLYSLNLQQHVTAPTHVKGHTLDLIITRDTSDIISPIQYHPPVMSDHNPLLFHLLSPKPPPVKKTISFRKIKNIDIEKFKQDLSVTPLITAPGTTLDTLVTQYLDTLSSLLDRHAPVITKEVHIQPHMPWFNECILAAKREHRKAERRWCKSKLQEHLEQLQEVRKEVNRLVEQAKVEYYQGHIAEHARDQKAFSRWLIPFYIKRNQPLCLHKMILLI